MKVDPVIVIAGSRALPTGQAARVLVRFLASLPSDATILLRRGLFTQPGLFEAQVEQVADLLGLKIEWCQPQVEDPVATFDQPAVMEFVRGTTIDDGRPVYAPVKVGRQLVWKRDVEMVARADLVLTFITPDQIGDDSSGTVALADKAMHESVPVYSYAMHEYGPDAPVLLERVGEHDPKNLWAGLVPAAS